MLRLLFSLWGSLAVQQRLLFVLLLLLMLPAATTGVAAAAAADRKQQYREPLALQQQDLDGPAGLQIGRRQQHRD